MDNLYRRNMNKKNVEPLAVDEWLKNEGYFRKAAPKDPGCLFRAVSEQIYMTQFYHTRVRKECVEFMRKHKHLFKHHKGIGTIDNYLEQMSSVNEWGGMTEIEAMSLLYKREFVVFYAGQSTALKKKEVTNNGFDKNIYLCFTPPRHYETVYKNHIIATAAFCQSIVYKILYKNVFKMPDVDAIVEKMLHDDGNSHDNRQQSSSVSLFNKADGQLTVTPPFPYRVAKALDPNIYRNTDFDIWWELKRQVRSAGLLRWNNYRLQVGGKCFVRVNDDVDIGHEHLNSNNYNNKYNNNGHVRKNLMLIGHIQEMAQNEGPVVVFIEELGEKKTVPFKALVPLNSRHNYLPASMMLSPVSPKNKSTDDSTNNKFKKQFNGYRKAKDSRSPVTSPRFNSNDDENNNNRNSSNYKTPPSKINYSNNFNNKTKSDSFAKNNSNADYSHKKTFANSQSQSILPKPPSPESANPNSNLPPDVRDFERRNSLIEDNKYITTSKVQNNFQAHDDKDSSPPCNSVPETFPIPVSGEFHPYNEINEVNSVCIPQSDEMYTNQSQIYCEDKNFGESQGSLPPGGFINYSHQVNFRVSPSLDINGNDLPYSDITTLRYFFNLGLEYFHVNQMWWPQGEVPYPAAPPNTPLSPPPSPHAHNFAPENPPGLPVESVQMQSDNMIQQYDNAADAQIHYSQPPNPQQRRYINPVCPNDNQTGENNSSAFKNFRKKSPVNSNSNNNNNKYLMKYKNEQTDAYNFGKPKYIQGYNENMKELNGGNTPRKNQFGKFKKTNQGYQNRTCSKTNYQNDYQQKSYISCSPDDNYKKKFEKKTTYDYQQQSGAQQQQQKTQLVPTDAPQNQSPQNNCTMPQQMTFANVPYYPNEQENNNVYSPPHTNMYPVSYVPHNSELPEPNNFSGAVMYSSGNYPQQMPPIYSQMMYPPGPPLLPHLTPIFPGMPGQNSQPDWCVPGQPNCVPYPYPTSQASESLPLTQSQVKK